MYRKMIIQVSQQSFAGYINGELVGYKATRLEAERMLDQLIYELYNPRTIRAHAYSAQEAMGLIRRLERHRDRLERQGISVLRINFALARAHERHDRRWKAEHVWPHTWPYVDCESTTTRRASAAPAEEEA